MDNLAVMARETTADEWFEEEEARTPGFIAAIDAGAGRLVLARELRKLREAAGLSQSELAAKVGTKQPGIARAESGEVMPTLDLVFKIASACGYRVALRFEPRKKERRPPKRARRG